MEILQTIWTALTTPNEVWVNIQGIPLSFIEITVTMLLFISVLNINATKKQKLTYVLILSLWTILSTLLIPKSISVFINMIIPLILIMLIFHISLLKSILAEILPNIVIVLLDTIFSKIYFTFFNITQNDAINIPIFRLSTALVIYSVIFLLYLILKHFHFNIKFFDNMTKSDKFVLGITFLFSIITIATQFYLVGYYNEFLPSFITLLSLVSLIAYTFLSFYSLYRTTQLQVTTQNLEEAQLYNKSLKILHDNVRAFKHDFSNIVQAIGGYITTNDINGLKVYYSQLLDDCQKVNNLYTLSPDVINNPAIYSLLTSKYHKADELGIKINLEVFLNLNELNMKVYEFTRVLGILMDNAIEAAKECDKKVINVEIRKDFKVKRQLVIIENTYKEKTIDLDKIYEKGYSSKPNNTGLGLWEVRQIMKKNTNLNLYTSKNDEFFSQQLEIYL